MHPTLDPILDPLAHKKVAVARKYDVVPELVLQLGPGRYEIDDAAGGFAEDVYDQVGIQVLPLTFFVATHLRLDEVVEATDFARLEVGEGGGGVGDADFKVADAAVLMNMQQCFMHPLLNKLDLFCKLLRNVGNFWVYSLTRILLKNLAADVVVYYQAIVSLVVA